MNFPNRRFSSPSIREYQTSKGDSGPRKKRPEPKPILNKPKMFPQSTSCPNQKHCKDHGLLVSTHHENVLNPRISQQKQIFTWLKNVLLKHFHELFSLSCALKEIWFRKRHEPKFLRPKNQFDFIHDENFSKLALPHSFPNSFTVWPDFEIDKPIFGNHFTCFILAHVLDDYPKGLDPDFDVLRIEKPFDYFFHGFDVVSLVILNEQDKHDQFPRRASTGECLRTCVRGTWNRTCLRETISNLQGSFCPNFSFTEFSMNFKSFVSDLFPFDTCTMDLRTNPFEERGNDVPQSKDHYMEPAQHEVQDVLSISTEVHVFHHARLEKDHARLEKDHARLDLDHEVSQNVRDFSILARLARTACTNDRADDLSTLFDPIMDFSFGNFSKARILKLSEDLGFVGTQLVRSERPAALADRPAYVLILTALDLAGSDASGQKPNGHFD
ncbi:hypothetical protein F2Q69_00005024 [Brassica cretica]|uniref:Uncharacterized protein n=1 Tax=Brassica cretica TaxID=69181 RepID=A0A8S9NYE7_BRACR|nr:hypothetical protein F2Q69_00005024 [Brassica cretica]